MVNITELSLMVTKRNGEVVSFDPTKIKSAISKAVRAAGQSLEEQTLNKIVEDIVEEVQGRFVDFFPNVENVQDIVEKHLVKGGLYEIAKLYILYRDKRKEAREKEKKEVLEKVRLGKLRVKKSDGIFVLFDYNKIREEVVDASKGYEKETDIDLIVREAIKNIYDGVSTEEITKALILASISFIEKDPSYSYVSGRLFFNRIFREVVGESPRDQNKETMYGRSFVYGIQRGVEHGPFDKRLLDFNLERLSEHLKPERDGLLQYMGMQTLHERYFARVDDRVIELPQSYWMRVAMGLAINEKDKNEEAIEFYEAISSLRYMPSTPTLFHSGTQHPQLSSCFLNTVMDDLHHIFKVYGDNAQMSKWSGGIATDWTNVRATGATVKSVNIGSQGTVPFLKIANDVTVAISRSGKRKGATCSYLETWHLDVEDFLDLRKNTGDERRRTHDMNTANWIPDLFMKRVIANEDWTLFSPEEVPELHHLYGRKFEKKYEEYEEKAKKGQMKKYKVVSALKLWRKMLSMLFETGHPWMTFKDPCNIRSPQDHAGVIHNSNLCTEITLNNSEEETAVCNLGSVNLGKHVVNGQLDKELIAKTVKSALRMLDNVIDINFYTTPEGKASNLRHRPTGLGIMGFQDALYLLDINFDSQEAISFADKSMELISYYAILASSEIAKERGKYESYNGSKWSRGIFPVDTLDLLEEEREIKINVSRTESLDWSPVKAHVKQYGMRNSNVMAIAPTATISTISGCYPCIEPIYKNIYVKSNMSGEFTVVNPYLIEDLKKTNLWNQEMLEQLKYYDGNLEYIAGIPENLKRKYKEVFEIDDKHLIDITAARGKWIDQSQSFNLFIKGVSGSRLSEAYIYAWQMGLKTTYYLRTLAASQIEKSTLDASKFGFTQKREYKIISPEGERVNGIEVSVVNKKEEAMIPKINYVEDVDKDVVTSAKLCLIDDPDCEACQ